MWRLAAGGWRLASGRQRPGALGVDHEAGGGRHRALGIGRVGHHAQVRLELLAIEREAHAAALVAAACNADPAEAARWRG